MKTKKYTLDSYYKYCFYVTCEEGKEYCLDSEYCNAGDIYKFEIQDGGEMILWDDGNWRIDGYEMKEVE